MWGAFSIYPFNATVVTLMLMVANFAYTSGHKKNPEK